MSYPAKVSVEQVVEAYKATGSVWKSAKRLGICGQSVWERLRAMDYPMQSVRWTAEEVEELKQLLPECSLSEIAERLGRPYAGVAGVVSNLGLSARARTLRNKLPRGRGYTKRNAKQWAREILSADIGIRPFAIRKRLSVESLIHCLQQHQPQFWENWVRTHSDLPRKKCAYCEQDFYPVTAKAKTCSRRCQRHLRSDRKYFGGRRRHAIGMVEGVCQLCLEKKETLSAHHIFGKQHDPENEHLIALCTGCHQIVGILIGRLFLDHREGWERLVGMVMLGKLRGKWKDGKVAGIHACVDFEQLTPEEMGYYPEAAA